MTDSPSTGGAHDVLLADGGSARIRPVRADDAPRIAAFHRALSLDTIQFRYFSGLRTLPPLILRRFSQPDPERDLVLVAEVADELIALASGHRRPAEDTAEVAFVVADAHQGRGLGTLLLEELAERARALGIAYFRADTLTRNRAMLRVFHDAGFDVERRADSTLVHVHFPILSTPRAQAAHELREHLAEARSLQRFVSPRSVLLAGGRADGFSGTIYTDLRSLPTEVDLALFTGEARALEPFMHACADAGVHALIVGELRDGPHADSRADFDRELRAMARAQGMRLLGPDSLGVLNTAPGAGLQTVELSELPGRGAIGVASESRARGAALLRGLAHRHLGVSTFISLGRRADVSANDCLAYWLDDASTRAVVLELRGCGNPHKFARVAGRVIARKPVLAFATGDPGQDAQLSAVGVEVLSGLDAVLERLHQVA